MHDFLSQFNTNQLFNQIQLEITWHRGYIISLKRAKLQLQRKPLSPLIRERIIAIENEIVENENRLLQMNHVFNRTD